MARPHPQPHRHGSSAVIVVGNPPFNGSRRLRQAIGDEALKRLEDRFDCGICDYCVYWFRKTADYLEPDSRAGLVATNSIAQHQAREASLDYVADGGVLTDVVPSQTWQGDAAVHVSIVNWVHEPEDPPDLFRIDHAPVDDRIGTDLRPAALSVVSAVELPANDGIAFQGPIPGNGGFIVDDDTAAGLRCLLGLNGLRVAEACAADVEDLTGTAYQPMLHIVGKGDRPAKVVINPRTHQAMLEYPC